MLLGYGTSLTELCTDCPLKDRVQLPWSPIPSVIKLLTGWGETGLDKVEQESLVMTKLQGEIPVGVTLPVQGLDQKVVRILEDLDTWAG